ncbi:hypothetical protein SAMN04490188_5585 [Pseudomonas kilonensis]|uniref:Uncharacterized protein n=1 Tax=Pseudomonas kilonensis TaxID=132476 RepID=A0ABY0ZIK4_9PSED|nr:hypothetical protein SAMN04490188_5585 [Pseudomonas kilonensis]
MYRGRIVSPIPVTETPWSRKGGGVVFGRLQALAIGSNRPEADIRAPTPSPDVSEMVPLEMMTVHSARVVNLGSSTAGAGGEYRREQISSRAGFEVAGDLGAAALAGFGLSFSRRNEG